MNFPKSLCRFQLVYDFDEIQLRTAHFPAGDKINFTDAQTLLDIIRTENRTRLSKFLNKHDDVTELFYLELAPSSSGWTVFVPFFGAKGLISLCDYTGLVGHFNMPHQVGLCQPAALLLTMLGVAILLKKLSMVSILSQLDHPSACSTQDSTFVGEHMASNNMLEIAQDASSVDLDTENYNAQRYWLLHMRHGKSGSVVDTESLDPISLAVRIDFFDVLPILIMRYPHASSTERTDCATKCIMTIRTYCDLLDYILYRLQTQPCIPLCRILEAVLKNEFVTKNAKSCFERPIQMDVECPITFLLLKKVPLCQMRPDLQGFDYLSLPRRLLQALLRYRPHDFRSVQVLRTVMLFVEHNHFRSVENKAITIDAHGDYDFDLKLRYRQLLSYYHNMNVTTTSYVDKVSTNQSMSVASAYTDNASMNQSTSISSAYAGKRSINHNTNAYNQKVSISGAESEPESTSETSHMLNSPLPTEQIMPGGGHQPVMPNFSQTEYALVDADNCIALLLAWMSRVELKSKCPALAYSALLAILYQTRWVLTFGVHSDAELREYFAEMYDAAERIDVAIITQTRKLIPLMLDEFANKLWLDSDVIVSLRREQHLADYLRQYARRCCFVGSAPAVPLPTPTAQSSRNVARRASIVSRR